MPGSTTTTNELLQSVGRFRYTRPDGGYRVVVEIDSDLAAFYRALIPKWMPVQPPRFRPHVTVVRIGRDKPKDMTAWGKYDGKKLWFHYDPVVQYDETYYWINVWCDQLADVRKELGLEPRNKWTRPPSGDFKECFHSTIGNRKHVR